jgi:DNA-binding MarR family transcriptional regulator
MTEPRWLDDTQQAAWRALLALVNRGLPQLEHTFKAHGLLAVHYSILVGLSASADDTMRLSDLADAANVSQSRLTHRLRTLVDRNIIEVTADSADGRGKNATLTASGRQLLESLAPSHAENVQQMLFDHLTATETANIASGLAKIAAHLCNPDPKADPKTDVAMSWVAPTARPSP